MWLIHTYIPYSVCKISNNNQTHTHGIFHISINRLIQSINRWIQIAIYQKKKNTLVVDRNLYSIYSPIMAYVRSVNCESDICGE